jgi:cytochrome c biogenesis protein CcdA/thiol-disulfide isomerase/thioredoxin
MLTDYVNITLAFIEGIALIVSPCILPILPIVLSGSLSGGKSRPLGIIAGFIVTFSAATLFTRALVQFAHLNPDLLRYLSYILLILFGLIMLSRYLTEKFASLTQRFGNIGSQSTTLNNTSGGFGSGFLFGALVGIIWTPCVGPILAAVIVQVALQQTTLSSVLLVLSFALGAAIPMLLIALIGRRVMEKFSFLRTHTALIRQLLGFIIILSVVLLMFGFSLADIQTIKKTQAGSSASLQNGLFMPYAAPEIKGIDAWINSPPLTLSELKGKVVLIDFWTYSCINCIRTLPYLIDWYAKYHDKGFEIIGVHTPEFEFEKNLDNVKAAVVKDGIRYPVALDNQYATWRSFNNAYWPAHYLINKEGDVVYTHFGEGEYDVTENNIRVLLGMNKETIQNKTPEVFVVNQTPETYLGYARAESFAGQGNLILDKVYQYQYPSEIPENSWALQGPWIVYADRIVSSGVGASIKLHFYAAKVYAVMGEAYETGHIKIHFAFDSGSTDKTIDVTMKQLYTLLDSDQPESGMVELVADRPGLEIYTFTFGS